MKIAPESIRKVDFRTSMRGYDKEEVRAYLQRFADELEELQNENESLKKELEETKVILEEFRRIENSIQEKMLQAEESAARTAEISKTQSDTMIREAESRALQIIEKAKKQAKDIQDAVSGLKEEKNLLISKLKAVITSQSNLLEMKSEDPLEKPGESKPSEPARKLDININDIADKIKDTP